MRDMSTVAAQTEPPTTARVANRQFLRLSEKWALAYDNAQWIVQRRKAPSKKGGECRWAAVSFVGSNKDILWRVLREKGAEIGPAARAYIDAMPETFREWVSMPPERRFKGGHSAMLGVVVGRIAPALERSRDLAKNAA